MKAWVAVAATLAVAHALVIPDTARMAMTSEAMEGKPEWHDVQLKNAAGLYSTVKNLLNNNDAKRAMPEAGENRQAQETARLMAEDNSVESMNPLEPNEINPATRDITKATSEDSEAVKAVKELSADAPPKLENTNTNENNNKMMDSTVANKDDNDNKVKMEAAKEVAEAKAKEETKLEETKVEAKVEEKVEEKKEEQKDPAAKMEANGKEPIDDPAKATASLAASSAPPQARMTIAIPCIPRDVSHLKRIVWAAKKQTAPTKEVIISMSETTAEEGAKLQAELNEVFSPVIVKATPGKLGPGENRNVAASLASGDFITFMDADDEMHPQRNEILEWAFDNLNAISVIHTRQVVSPDDPYLAATDSRWPAISHDDIPVLKGKTIYEKTAEHYGGIIIARWGVFPAYSQDENHADIASGHASFRRWVMQGENSLQYSSDLRGEDNMFLKSVLKKYGPNERTMVLIKRDLIRYRPSAHPDNDVYNKNMQQKKKE